MHNVILCWRAGTSARPRHSNKQDYNQAVPGDAHRFGKLLASRMLSGQFWTTSSLGLAKVAMKTFGAGLTYRRSFRLL